MQCISQWWHSIGAIGACLVYGFLCRIIPGRWLIHLAIAAGVLSTLAYVLVEGVQSAFVVSIFVGFVYMLGNLIQLDLAARMCPPTIVCPPTIAGSMFAMLMSVSNLAIITSTILGGWLYEKFATHGGPEYSYTTADNLHPANVPPVDTQDNVTRLHSCICCRATPQRLQNDQAFRVFTNFKANPDNLFFQHDTFLMDSQAAHDDAKAIEL